jgi:hypothetical protein
MNVDFSEILGDRRFQAAIGPNKFEQYSSDETGQQMIEDFENESQTLMTLIDNGGGNSYGFYKWHGFYFWNNTQSSDNGASDNLEDLFDDPVFVTPPDQIEIESEELPIETLCKFAKKLLQRINENYGSDDEICINGTDFKLAGDELVEV